MEECRAGMTARATTSTGATGQGLGIRFEDHGAIEEFLLGKGRSSLVEVVGLAIISIGVLGSHRENIGRKKGNQGLSSLDSKKYTARS